MHEHNNDPWQPSPWGLAWDLGFCLSPLCAYPLLLGLPVSSTAQRDGGSQRERERLTDKDRELYSNEIEYTFPLLSDSWCWSVSGSLLKPQRRTCWLMHIAKKNGKCVLKSPFRIDSMHFRNVKMHICISLKRNNLLSSLFFYIMADSKLRYSSYI